MSSDFRTDSVVIDAIGNLSKKSFLEVGCGLGKWGYSIKLGWSGEPTYSVGVDAWPKNLHFVKAHGVYDDVILADARALPFADKSIDTVIACAFLHCMKKSDGFILINEIERVSTGKTILTVPNNETTFAVDPENPFEEDCSNWTSTDLKNLGYEIKGVGFQFKGHRFLPSVLTGLSQVKILSGFGEILVAKKNTCRSSIRRTNQK
jgi:ubiquinone/menaquinone biosynthesis C-methylase UbiE